MPRMARVVLLHMPHHLVQRGHNRLEGRSGTLWEGRYKSRRVQTETYLLACTLHRAQPGPGEDGASGR